MRSYCNAGFIETVADKTRTPVMLIATHGMGAGSNRYHDIAVDAMTRGSLMVDDQAFLSFADVDEANALFDAIIAGYPQPCDTTLGIEVLLALPRAGVRQFRQIHGDAEGRILLDPPDIQTARAA